MDITREGLGIICPALHLLCVCLMSCTTSSSRLSPFILYSGKLRRRKLSWISKVCDYLQKWGYGILWWHKPVIHKNFLRKSYNLQKFSPLSFPLCSIYILCSCIVCVLMYQLKMTQMLLVPQVAQLINYAKNLHEEEKHIVRTLRLQQDAIW